MDQGFKMKLGMQVGLGPGHIVLDRDPASPPPKVHSPQFSAHNCCGEMAAWIKMSFGKFILRQIVKNVAWPDAYLRTKWPLDPTSRLATIHGPKSGDVPLWGGELGPDLTQCGQGRGYPPCQVSS